MSQLTYGLISRGASRKVSAHRMSYAAHKGPIPPGMVVRHKCDTPACVNPDHLEPGTQADNIADMFKRGRAKCKGTGRLGEQVPNAVLTEALVEKVAEAIRAGQVWRQIAKDMGCRYDDVYRVGMGKAWNWKTGFKRLGAVPDYAKAPLGRIPGSRNLPK
jgi:hypothetical protein